MLQPGKEAGMFNDAFHGYVVHLGRDFLMMDAKFTLSTSRSDTRCAQWSKRWFQICWGVVRASRNSSGLQGKDRLTRYSIWLHVAVTQTCARSPFEPLAGISTTAVKVVHNTFRVLFPLLPQRLHAHWASLLGNCFLDGCLHSLISDLSFLALWDKY